MKNARRSCVLKHECNGQKRHSNGDGTSQMERFMPRQMMTMKLTRKYCSRDKPGGTKHRLQNSTGRQGTYKRNIEERSRNHCYRRKAISTIYSGVTGIFH